tara:strand:- start:167 stop:532 length:366 start_codon:yes stop_codon:yes gene_type:complete
MSPPTFNDVEAFVEAQYANCGITVIEVSGPAIAGLRFSSEMSDIGSFAADINSTLSVVCDLRIHDNEVVFYVWPAVEKIKQPRSQSRRALMSNAQRVGLIAIACMFVFVIVLWSGRTPRRF